MTDLAPKPTANDPSLDQVVQSAAGAAQHLINAENWLASSDTKLSQAQAQHDQAEAAYGSFRQDYDSQHPDKNATAKALDPVNIKAGIERGKALAIVNKAYERKERALKRVDELNQ